MKRARTEKPLRTPIYLGHQRRAAKLARLRTDLGLSSDSEVVRRLIDEARLPGEPPVDPVARLLHGLRLPARGLDLLALQQRLEQALIERALERAQGNLTRAARLLGLSRSTLQRKLLAHGLGAQKRAVTARIRAAGPLPAPGV